jgi:squalene cyclase
MNYIYGTWRAISAQAVCEAVLPARS